MPGRTSTSRYSLRQESEFRFAVLDVLETSKRAMNLDEIKAADPYLAGLTSQKLSRVLSFLIDMNLVRKGQSKAQKRMLYKAVSVMEEEGYTGVE